LLAATAADGMRRATSGAKVGPDNATTPALGSCCSRIWPMVRPVSCSMPLATLTIVPEKLSSLDAVSRKAFEGMAITMNGDRSIAVGKLDVNSMAVGRLILGR